MATVLFLGHNAQLFDDNGDPLASGKMYFYEPGSATAKDTYTDETLGTPNANPVILNSAGRAEIWLDGSYKVVVKDSDDGDITTTDNVNYSTSVASAESNLISNASFETNSTGDGKTPDNWTLTEYSSSTVTLDATEQRHGAKSFKATSAGSGGGMLETTAYFEVSTLRTLDVSFHIQGTAAVRNLVEIEWFTAAQVTISSTSIYDEDTNNPASWTLKQYNVTPPATAAYAKFRLYACHPNDATTGSTWYDNIEVRAGNFMPVYIGGTGGGSDNAYTLTTTQSVVAYAEHQVFTCVAVFGNTTSATMNVNLIGAKTIKKAHDLDLQSGDIEAGQVILFAYKETEDVVQLLSPTAGAAITQGTHTIWLPAASMRPAQTGGCQPISVLETTAGNPDIVALAFDTDEYAQFSIAMPNSWNEGTVTFIPYWTFSTGSAAETVVWDLQGVAVSNDGGIDVAYGTEQNSQDTAIAAEDLHVGPESSGITINGSPAAGDMCFFQIFRDTSVDDLAGDALLIGIKLLITINAKDDS